MNYNKKTVLDVDVSGKKVLLRCDFNVPQDKETGAITSDKRIVAALPTIRCLLEQKAAVIACSHLGKPKGEWKAKLSLAPVAQRLSELLGQEVIFAKDIVGEDAKAKAAALQGGQIMLLENLRFDPREEKNDPSFAEELASMAELYVSDAFGTVHRAHASTAGVAAFLPAVSGLLVAKELEVKGGALTGMYYDYALAAPCMAGMDGTDNENRSVMILGMGSGTYASYCTRYFPGASVQGAEIDGKIADIARTYFGLPEEVEVAVADGRAYLTASEEKFDVIMVDAYQDITIPFQMSSVEFFTLVKDHLNEDGVMVVNMNMRGSGDGNINQYLSDTIGQVFDAEYTVDVANTTNRELFASNNPSIMENLHANTKQITNADLRNMMETVYADSTPYGKGDYILTDDKAPVELLGMQVIDQLIEEEVAYYKGIYERDGIQGVLNSL